MEVYVVTYDGFGDIYPIRVFSSEEKAKEYVEKQDTSGFYVVYSITKFKVDSEDRGDEIR